MKWFHLHPETGDIYTMVIGRYITMVVKWLLFYNYIIIILVELNDMVNTAS